MKRWMPIGVVLCVSITAIPARAEVGLAFESVGPTVSWVVPDQDDGVVGYGFLAGLGTITERVSLDVTGDFWSRKKGSIKVQDLSFGARAMVHLPAGETLDPALGAGLSGHFLRTEISGLGPGVDDTDSKTRLGFDFAGETGFTLTRKLELVAQVVYRLVPTDVGLGGSDALNQFCAGAGLVFRIGDDGDE